ALRHLFQHPVGIAGAEQVHLRIADPVLHVERHGDDVLVARQHGQGVAEGAHAGGVDRGDAFDRPRRLEVGAGLHDAGELAEAQHHATVLFADQHEAVEGQPQRQADGDPAQRAAATAAAEQAAELVEDAVEGTTAAATAAAARRPWVLATVAAAIAARTAVVVVLAGDVPGHAGSSLGIPPPGTGDEGTFYKVRAARCARGRESS